MDEIEACADRYETRHGRRPTNISHWDPSPETVTALREGLPVPHESSPVPYRYSYEIENKALLLDKIGFRSRNVALQLTENGTTSVAAVANWLNLSGVTEVVLLEPTYFSTYYSLRRFGMKVRRKDMAHDGRTFRLPDDLDLCEGQALWLTNPVYNTGVDAFDRHLDRLNAIVDSGACIVSDESLTALPSSLASSLGGHERFVGIYTPHKSICMNGLKFSAVAVHEHHEISFVHWADILSGGLGVSALAAMDHFLSPGFDAYSAAFERLIEAVRDWYQREAMKHGPLLRHDAGVKGHFLMAYVPRLKHTLGEDIGFLAETMEATGAMIIPGNRSGFGDHLGFSFRVNLAQDSPQFRSAICRLFDYLRGCVTP